MHSKTIPKAPFFSRALASLTNLFFSFCDLPTDLNFPFTVCGVKPIWPRTGILFLTKWLTICCTLSPPSTFTASHLVSLIATFEFFKASDLFRYVL